ncbi:acetyltransferase [Allostella sp. ATCC 35155]|nr:acetyltransferase [Stella sp. ATCC 35155]
MSAALGFRRWVKRREHPVARAAWRLAHGLRSAEMPCLPALHAPLYRLSRAVSGLVGEAARFGWWTPLFRSQLARSGRGLRLEGSMPLLMGPLSIEVGSDVTINGQTTITGRDGGGSARAFLSIGDRTYVGWQTTIAVGTRVVIGRDVKIAGRCLIAGYPGHPLDPEARAAGQPCRAEQIGPVVLEDGVWLATGVTVVAGVRIGAGTVVAAGSVVTRDLPARVLAAGAPARVVREIARQSSTAEHRP